MPVDRLALLRGINVGGENLVKMADLREAFAALGASDVETHIASGNVLYRGSLGAAAIEAGLDEHLGVELKVVVKTARRLHQVVDEAPDVFGAEDLSCDVIFLRPPLTAARAFRLFDPREGVDQVWKGRGVIYHARLSARRTASRMSRIVEFPDYKEMTIRGWRTTAKLADLLADRERRLG